jgi:hypothetical protein
MRGALVGRDVGSDEGREQAEWRDLVARLELQASIDPADAPWPDRENLHTKTQPGIVNSTDASGQTGPALDSDGRPDDAGPEGATGGDTEHGDSDHGDTSHGGRGSADRSRVIRPAGLTRFDRPAEPAATTGADDSQVLGSGTDEPAAAPTADIGEPTLGGPRDYDLDEPGDGDLDEDYDDRYIPPPLPPQPGLDPVAKGAWLALFGGPGYLLVATLLSWQIAGWAALTAVIAFVAGFVVLVFRLGDGPSKRDGPDQGAVV